MNTDKVITRSLVKQGSNAYTITIPINWVRDNCLDPGDTLELSIKDNSILVSANKKKIEKRFKEVIFTDSDILNAHPMRYINRIFSALFKAGFEEIKISSSNREILDYVINKSESFIGLEVIEDRNESVILRSIVDLRQEDFDKLFIRAFGILKSMSQALLEGDNLKEVVHLEKTNNKITDYLKRLLSEKRWETTDKYYYCIIVDNERLADEFKYLSQALMENKTKDYSKYIKEFKEIERLISLLFSQINKDSKENLKKISEIRSSYMPKDNISFHIKNIYIQIYELIESILELRFFAEDNA